MEITEEQYRLLERYLTGLMPDEEARSFEQEVAANKSLQEFIEIYENADEFIGEGWVADIASSEGDTKDMALEQFKSKVAEMISDQSAGSKGSSRLLWIAGAAAAVILLFVVLWPGQPSTEDVYAEYSNWNSLPSFTTKGVNGDKQAWIHLEEAFEAGDYSEATGLANGILNQENTDSASALLYLGASYLELNEYDKALEAFGTLTQTSSLDHHQGYWYQAMTYLKKGDKESAMSILKLIEANPTYYKHQEAVEILEEWD